MLLRLHWRHKGCLRGFWRSFATVDSDPFNSVVGAIAVKRAAPTDGPAYLDGTTYVAKDNFAAGPTTCGSAMLSNYTSPFDATAVQLLDGAGLLMVGKANMDEFGMGSASIHSHYGPTLNPLFDDPHVAGGSSGGSAAAVASKLATFGLGTDTGGSVRLPASYCGIVGFKPTYGRISRWGVVAYAQSLDTVGILAREVEMVQRVFGVLDKYDEKDPTSLSNEIRGHFGAETKAEGPKTIGVVKELIVDNISPETKENWTKLLSNLVEKGHKVQVVSVPSIRKLLSAYYTLVTAEAASNLSRFDGVRYGLADETTQDSAADLLSQSRSSGLGAEVQRRILLGNYTLSSESGNHYVKATEIRQKLVEELNQVFAAKNHLLSGTAGDCDFLICPTATGPAPSVASYKDQTEKNFLTGYLNDVLTVPASLAGIPSISLPFGARGLGMQIMAQHGDDINLLEFSKQIQPS